MVISDGAPVDDSTLSVNPSNYLERHLRQVIEYIEHHSPVELLAIGIGHDVTPVLPACGHPGGRGAARGGGDGAARGAVRRRLGAARGAAAKRGALAPRGPACRSPGARM